MNNVMANLKNLFALKKSEPKKIEVPNSETEDTFEKARITYYEKGMEAARSANGNEYNFGIALNNVYYEFEMQCKKLEQEQHQLKQPYKEAQERQRTELKRRDTAQKILQEKKDELESKIEKKRFEMTDVKENPDKYGVPSDKRPKAQFYIGLLLLLPITIYLIVFYISASYSAFFKNFETSSLTAAIFDADALGKALRDGWLEATFVVTIPFVFMGLGYLIHMFHKIKGWQSTLKLIALFLVAFVFDVILAYLIEKKIFLFEALVGQQFTPADAISSVNFWGIIFAGFVVYIIWGLVLDFVMKEHENMDLIKAFIRSKREEIQNYQKEIDNIDSKLPVIRDEINGILGEISELQSKIDGFILPVKKYLNYHYQFAEGWFRIITSEIALPHREQEELLLRCRHTSEDHLQRLGLNNTDFQNLLYTANT
jgi:phage-related tail protein